MTRLITRRGGRVAEPTWLYLDRAEPFRDQDGSVLAYIEAAARIAALAIAHREGLHAAAERERLAAEQSQARRVQTQLCASRNGRASDIDYAFSTEPGAGMCGDFDSVIGMEKAEPMRRFITGMSKGRFVPAEGAATLCGVLVETDDRTGRAKAVTPIRQGGRLDPAQA